VPKPRPILLRWDKGFNDPTTIMGFNRGLDILSEALSPRRTEFFLPSHETYLFTTSRLYIILYEFMVGGSSDGGRLFLIPTSLNFRSALSEDYYLTVLDAMTQTYPVFSVLLCLVHVLGRSR